MGSGFFAARCSSGGGIPAPHLSIPLRVQPLPGEFLCCSNPGKLPVPCSFGELLCSLEQRELFAAGSPRFPQAPLLAQDAVPGWLAGKGWCREPPGPAASSLPWGRVVTQKCHLWVFQETEMGPCRIQEENAKVFPLPPITSLKWPKEEVLSARKNIWVIEKPWGQQHFTGLYRGSALVKDLPAFMHCPTNLN